MRILRKQKNPTGKPACGHRRASGDVHVPSSTFGGSLLALESRIMFDGAAVATVGTVTTEQIAQSQAEASFSVDDATTVDSVSAAPTGEPQADANQALFDALAAYDPSTVRQEIVFLSPSVRDYQKLLDGISPNVEVIVLDPTLDGVEQMAEALSGRSGIDALHVISYGSQGELQFGTGRLNLESMSGQYADELAMIQRALSEQADILLYGCNFAEGDIGQAAVIRLAELTGADVQASNDLTGSERLGGDWTLEVQTGAIESAVVVSGDAQATYADLLDITTGLVGRWTFDSNANDASGNGNHGTLGGNATIDTTTATNIVGTGKLSLDGVDDYVDLTSHTSSFSGLTQGTIAAWVKSTATGDRTIFDIGDGATAQNFVSFFVNNGKLTLSILDGNAQVLITASTASINDGNWHQVAFTVNGSGNQLYIDGAAAARTFTAGSSSTTTFISALNSTINTTIGAFNDGAINGEFLGTLDDVRVYNRALTGADVTELYELSNPIISNLAGDSLAYNEADGAVVIEQGANATVADVGSANFDTGTLTVSFTAGSDAAEDVLAIRNQGTGVGQIGVSGANVTYQGVTIGTFTGGSSGTDLVITFNASSTVAAAQALVQNITYQDTDTAAPTTGARTVRFVLTDGDGGTSANYDTAVTVSGVNDASIAADDRLALDFDGVDDYVQISSNPVFEVTTHLTMEVWINPDASTNARQIIINREGEYEVALDPNGHIQWAFANADPGWAWHDTGVVVPLHTWSHIAISYDNGVITTYLNGVAAEVYNGSGAIGDNHVALDELRIGGRSNAPAGQYFDGRINEVQVWNVARSGAEVLTDMAGGLTGGEAGLLGFWRFNENSGTTVNNLVLANNDGTLGGGVSGESPAWTGYRINEDSSLNVGAPGILSNDFDADGNPLTAALVTGPSSAGSFTLNPDGSFTYVPLANFAGNDSFTYRVNDGTVNSNVATVTIQVDPVNDPPAIADATVAVDENSANGTAVTNISDSFTATDFDRDGAALTYSITAGNTGGAFAINAATGAITVATSAALDYETTPSFTLTVQASDGTLTDTAAITVNLNNLNELPIVSPPPPPPPPPDPVPLPIPVPSPPGPPSGGVTPPVLPPPVLISMVNLPDDPAPRVALSSRTFASRVEQPDIVLEEPPALELEPLSNPVKTMLTMGHKLTEHLTRLADNLERAMQEREHQGLLLGRVASVSGMALSVGFVAWILRGGALVASFLVSMPAWRHFDPLPVLGSAGRDRRERDRQVREGDEQEQRQFRGLDRVLDKSAKPVTRQEMGRVRKPKSS